MVSTSLSAGRLRVYLLGTFQIELNAQSIHLPTRKSESLFAYLILHPDAHAREKLAALFWGDSPDENARGSLRKALTMLRKHIAKDIVLADRECIRLNSSSSLWVDAIEFEKQSRQFLDDPSTDLDRIDLEIYQDDLLIACYDDWILPLREHYRDLYLKASLCIVQQLRTQGEYKKAIQCAQKVLACDPANERAHQHLMFCYITLGDRNRALRQYDSCRCALEEEQGAEPSRQTQALHKWIQQAVLDIPSQAARVTNLPIPISSFVGRNREMAKIKAVLSRARMVTLTGAGGSGKTRLAIHVGTDLIDSFKDGVWWVELASLTDASLIPSAVAKALGVSESSDQPLSEILAGYLRKKQLLLVLDNCEHLIDAAAQLSASLLSACPDLKILSTSREALRLVGENVWVIPTLSLPETQKLTYAKLLMQYESILLFVERASAVRPGFSLTEENADAVAQICQRLDGIPLALELAAARVKMMSVEQIAARLDEGFQLLAAPNRTAQERHKTLRAAIDWSYDLLSEVERQLFCRLSVFAGGWTLEAAEAICSGRGIEQEDILYLLANLVDKSLVTVTADGKRYRMLETMRQYAKEKLIATGMEEWIVEQHLDYFVNLAETADEEIRGSEQSIWLQWLEIEHENLTAAIERSLNTPSIAYLGDRLVCALCWYWYSVGELILMRRWLEPVFHSSVSLGKSVIRARVLLNAGAYSSMRLKMLKPVEARAALEESLEMWRELGSDYTLESAKNLLYLGYNLTYFSYDEKGVGYVQESIETFQSLENHWWHAWALNLYAVLIWMESYDYKSFRSTLEYEASLWKKIGDRHGLAIVLMDIGRLELENGNFIGADSCFKRSLEIFVEFKAKGFMQSVMLYLGDSARGMKKYDQAQEYYEKSIQLSHMIGRGSSIPLLYHELGYVFLHKYDAQRAEELFHQALKFDQEYYFKKLKENQAHNLKVNLVFSLMNFACLAASRNDAPTAGRLFGAFYANFEALQAERGLERGLISALDQLEIDHFLGLCQAQLDKNVYDKVYNNGSLLSLKEAIDEILQARVEKLILES